jgi:hypothetical protein
MEYEDEADDNHSVHSNTASVVSKISMANQNVGGDHGARREGWEAYSHFLRVLKDLHVLLDLLLLKF